jgi:hypothetical protein
MKKPAQGRAVGVKKPARGGPWYAYLMTSATILTLLLKPLLVPLAKLVYLIPARCGLLLTRRMPECWLKRVLTRHI